MGPGEAGLGQSSVEDGAGEIGALVGGPRLEGEGRPELGLEEAEGLTERELERVLRFVRRELEQLRGHGITEEEEEEEIT